MSQQIQSLISANERLQNEIISTRNNLDLAE